MPVDYSPVISHPEAARKLCRFLASKAFYKAAEVQLLWAPVGGSLLIHTHTEVDTTGSSYYGATGLFAMAANGKVQNVTLSKAVSRLRLP